jgi:hypothetical protein
LIDQLPGHAQEGGVRIADKGLQNGLAAEGGLEDLEAGYSIDFPLAPIAALKDPARNPRGQIDLAVPGLQVGTPSPGMEFPDGTTFVPYATMRNLTEHPLQVVPMKSPVGDSSMLSRLGKL